MNLSDFPHRRFNPLTGEWILVSPHRAKRPWQGKVEQPQPSAPEQYDKKCFLCPGNLRAGNTQNPKYETTFVFDNDFAGILPDIPVETMDEQGLLVARGEQGLCRVVCHSPRHNLSFPVLSQQEILAVVATWISQYVEIGSYENINHILIFENRGEIMGATSPHPHSQIWANASIPTLPAMETARQKEYLDRQKSCLLCDYVKLELRMQARIIMQNDSFAVITPFWAVWPFEAMVVPKEHYTDIGSLPKKVKNDFADVLKRLTTRFDNLFSAPFPYSMGIHQRPTDGDGHEEWHFHTHFLPPLLRSPINRKLFAGYELLAMPQRDVTPEDGARKLRSCSEMHYSGITSPV
jgi:UDPglucose--hexose-1-phosphate uridylyltransferase